MEAFCEPHKDQRGLAVQMMGICKRFGSVFANDAVNLSVQVGTVHGIVGENGAGKSTLMSILYGFYAADAGEISIFGKNAKIRNANEAISLGIGMVHQHFMLVDTLSALENVMLGVEPSWLLNKSSGRVKDQLVTLIQATGLTVNLDSLVADLSVGDRQRLEILKALHRGAKILILDEPTAVLTPQEAGHLFSVLKVLRERGTTILLITHKLKEVMSLCDFVTVMRSGKVVQDLAIAHASVEGLAEAMVGRKVQMGRFAEQVNLSGAALLNAVGITVKDHLNVTRLSDFNLTLRGGEIVGIAGVSGNGQSEVLEVLSGLVQPVEGTLTLGGRTFAPDSWLDPQLARQFGLAHVPEDRQARALVMDFAAWESAVLGYEGLAQYGVMGWMNHRSMKSSTSSMMEHFDVRPRSPDLLSSKFSGGNQQKLVLARELGQSPKVLLVGQPTRGVDIGAIEFIYAQLRVIRAAGFAVLVVSSELDEILALCDRVIVLNQGKITGELPIADCTEIGLGMLMTGGAA